MNHDIKSKDHRKPVARSGPDRRWWLVILAIFFGATFFLLATNRILQVAKRAQQSVNNAAQGMAEAFGTVLTIGVVSGLNSPDDQHRIDVLLQLDKTEVGECVQDCIADSVKLNLDHDNKDVREAASSVWDRIKDLPRISTNISLEAG